MKKQTHYEKGALFNVENNHFRVGYYKPAIFLNESQPL